MVETIKRLRIFVALPRIEAGEGVNSDGRA
jgi:hypothetical protein